MESKSSSKQWIEQQEDEQVMALSNAAAGVAFNTPERFLQKIRETFAIYLQYGGRSKRKTDFLHSWLAEDIKDVLNAGDGGEVKIEQSVPSLNASGKKDCDIVAFRNGKNISIFPVKFIMTNYKQNKNNGFENLTGEIMHLKWANENVPIIPINIIFNQVPYCQSSSLIKHYETITYEKSYKITEILQEKGLVYDTVNYIIDVNQCCDPGTPYNKCPEILGFNQDTPYRSFHEIL